ncbi:MAG TPA: helix-turn-helix domain-containing protein [Candidatus Thermoplasmatota archaeon]|nr:helix-turn-helix domain-containing protein [Candidatus Thermoplasmatota archaeon]
MTDAVSPGIYDTLRQLGLTEYGSRCYVALLSLKSGEAAEVAEAAEVPRTKVYAVLKDLADSGWVVAGGGRPVVYRPAPPDERIAEAEKAIAQRAADALRELSARFAMGAQMVPMTAYLLRGRTAIDAKTLEVISRAREELLLNLGFVMEGEVPALVDALRKAQRRGVKLHLLLGPTVDARGFHELAHDARRAVFPFRGVVCDWRQALVALPQPGGEPLAMWNPTAAFVEAIAPMLRGAWESAEPL